MVKDGKGWERMGKDGALALKGNARMAKVARDTHTKRMAKGAHENAGNQCRQCLLIYCFLFKASLSILYCITCYAPQMWTFKVF